MRELDEALRELGELPSRSWDDGWALKVFGWWRNHELRSLWEYSGQFTDATISGDGQWLAAVSNEATLRIFEMKGGREVRRAAGHSGDFQHVSLSEGGRLAVAGSGGATLTVWDLERGQSFAHFVGESKMLCFAVGFDKGCILAGEQSGRIHFLRLVLPEAPLG